MVFWRATTTACRQCRRSGGDRDNDNDSHGAGEKEKESKIKAD